MKIQPPRALRLPAVMSLTGLGRATIYRRIRESSFPKPIRLGGNSAGWIEAEVLAWLNSRIAERDLERSK